MDFASFQFELIAKDELNLPLYKGSAFRGLFGHALKSTVCVTKMSSCDGCLLRENCAYAYIFETYNNRNENVVHPFIIEPPMIERTMFPPGDMLKVNVILIGKAIDYLPYVVYTFRQMGQRGIGTKRGKFWLQCVTVGEKVVYDFQEQLVHKNFNSDDLFKLPIEKAEHIKINFITPTAIKEKGRVVNDIEFLTLIKALKRRVKAINIYHDGNSGFKFEYDLAHVSSIAVKTKKLKPYMWKRYSNRQEKSINFSGFIGELELEGDLTPYMPLLKIGEIIHVGRGTVYGMGKYQMINIGDS